MKIFYCGLEHHNYSGKGLSFEHQNFYESLRDFPGAEVVYFPYDRIPEIGRARYNEELVARVKEERPDLLFSFAVSDELLPAALAEIRQTTPTLVWFADDSWRFWNYSRFVAPQFSWAVTTYSWTPPLFKKYGQPNCIRSQWAANTRLYAPASALPHGLETPDVVFVGA